MVDNDEERIRRKAYELWEAEGRPENQGDRHWVMAREIIALEDSEETTRIPVERTRAGEDVEPAIAHENQGEFPTVTDQGGNPAGPDLGAAAEVADVRPGKARAGAKARGRAAAPTDSAGQDLTEAGGRAPTRSSRKSSRTATAGEGTTPKRRGKQGS